MPSMLDIIFWKINYKTYSVNTYHVNEMQGIIHSLR